MSYGIETQRDLQAKRFLAYLRDESNFVTRERLGEILDWMAENCTPEENEELGDILTKRRIKK